jgi:hypothetical protein
MCGRLLDNDNDDDTEHGLLVTTFLNHRDNNSIPSLPLLKHCHFPLHKHPHYTQLIHPSSPALGMRISALSSIP